MHRGPLHRRRRGRLRCHAPQRRRRSAGARVRTPRRSSPSALEVGVVASGDVRPRRTLEGGGDAAFEINRTAPAEVGGEHGVAGGIDRSVQRVGQPQPVGTPGASATSVWIASPTRRKVRAAPRRAGLMSSSTPDRMVPPCSTSCALARSADTSTAMATTSRAGPMSGDGRPRLAGRDRQVLAGQPEPSQFLDEHQRGAAVDTDSFGEIGLARRASFVQHAQHRSEVPTPGLGLRSQCHPCRCSGHAERTQGICCIAGDNCAHSTPTDRRWPSGAAPCPPTSRSDLAQADPGTMTPNWATPAPRWTAMADG